MSAYWAPACWTACPVAHNSSTQSSRSAVGLAGAAAAALPGLLLIKLSLQLVKDFFGKLSLCVSRHLHFWRLFYPLGHTAELSVLLGA